MVEHIRRHLNTDLCVETITRTTGVRTRVSEEREDGSRYVVVEASNANDMEAWANVLVRVTEDGTTLPIDGSFYVPANSVKENVVEVELPESEEAVGEDDGTGPIGYDDVEPWREDI